MNTKAHFKLHKVKKHWVAIAVVTASIMVFGGQRVVAADETASVNNNTSEQTISNTLPTSTVSEEENNKTQESTMGTDDVNTATEDTDEATTTDSSVDSPTETTTIDNTDTTDTTDSDKSSLQTDTATKESQNVSTPSDTDTKTTEKDHSYTGWKEVDHHISYFSPELAKGPTVIDGQTYYFSQDKGYLMNGGLIEDNDQLFYTNEDGVIQTGYQYINNEEYYFNEKDKNLAFGQMLKGPGYDGDGNYILADSKTGRLISDTFYYYDDSTKGGWYYANSDHQILTGYQTIDGINYYFDSKGRQLKGQGTDSVGHSIITDSHTGEIKSNAPEVGHFYENNGKWYYFDSDKKYATGWVTINNQKLYFKEDGRQAKGELITFKNDDNTSDSYYFDPDTGEVTTNQFKELEFYSNYYKGYSKAWMYFGDDGKAVKGWQDINGQHLYFYQDGRQAKNKAVLSDDKVYFLDPNSGEMWKNRFVEMNLSKNYHYDPRNYSIYVGEDGAALDAGTYTINGQTYIVNENHEIRKVEN